MTIKDDIQRLVESALNDLLQAEEYSTVTVKDFSLERPQDPKNGDFASSLPLKLARPLGMNPMTIAETLVSLIPVGGAISKVWTARPGFINFSLKESWLVDQVDNIRTAGNSYGNINVGDGSRIQIEFVSVNPTGPLHIAHARGGVIGSTLANILEASGFDVEREYYFNDAGAQVQHFNRSLYARYQQLFDIPAKIPEKGYHGEYMVDLARKIKDDEKDRFLHMSAEEAISSIGELGLKRMMVAIKDDVNLLRIHFDNWFNEASLYRNGQFDRCMQMLRNEGYVTDHEGAIWFASTSLGDEKDKVLVRSNGEPTYFASDVAYHYNKFIERNFDRVINVWGADHQGHASFLKAVMKALGIPEWKLVLIINQIVTLKREGEVVRLSKRTGNVITLEEVIAEVGVDACRFFFLSRSPESQMEFDMALAKKQSLENPVYYVQYAHARISSILRLATERNISYCDGDVSLLTHEAELTLIRKALELPEMIEMMSLSLEPHHLPHYSMELATAFHSFYQECRVVSSDPREEPITKARLKLAGATQVALARCLELMGMDTPEEM